MVAPFWKVVPFPRVTGLLAGGPRPTPVSPSQRLLLVSYHGVARELHEATPPPRAVSLAHGVTVCWFRVFGIEVASLDTPVSSAASFHYFFGLWFCTGPSTCLWYGPVRTKC